jgi:hypothetical protein
LIPIKLLKKIDRGLKVKMFLRAGALASGEQYRMPYKEDLPYADPYDQSITWRWKKITDKLEAES